MANSPLLKIPLLATSQAAKEDTINTMVSYLERSMNDAKTLTFAGGNLTLPEVDLQRYFMFKTSGAASTSVLSITPVKRMFVIDNIANGNDLLIDGTSDTIIVPAGGIVMIYCDGVNLINVTDSTVMGGGGGATTMLGLTDTPNSYAGAAKYVLRVKNDLTGVEFYAQKVSDMADVDVTGLADGYILQWSTLHSKFRAVALTAGGSSSNVYWKDAVTCATTEPLDLADVIVGFTIDAVTLTADSSILIKDQTDKSENGIYNFVAGVLTRRADANDATDLPRGAGVAVAAGAVNGMNIFFVSNEIPGIGADIEFDINTPMMTLLGLDDVDSSTPPTDQQVLTWEASLGGAMFKDPQGAYPPLTGQAGKVLTVNPTGTGVIWATSGASSYPSFGGNAGKHLAVNSGATDVEWVTPATPLPSLTGNAGKVLAVDSAGTGVEWKDTPPSKVTIATKTANYTLVLADIASYIRMNMATANTLTVPTNTAEAFPVGVVIPIRSVGAGQTTVVAASGVVINTAETLKLRTVHSAASLIKVGTNEWDLTGDLELAP